MSPSPKVSVPALAVEVVETVVDMEGAAMEGGSFGVGTCRLGSRLGAGLGVCAGAAGELWPGL